MNRSKTGKKPASQERWRTNRRQKESHQQRRESRQDHVQEPQQQKQNAKSARRKRPRSKNKQQKPQHESDSGSGGVMNEIEEQLRLQRAQRQQQKSAVDSGGGVPSGAQVKPDPPKNLGKYRYDPEKEAYFPEDSFPKESRQYHSSRQHSNEKEKIIDSQSIFPSNRLPWKYERHPLYFLNHSETSLMSKQQRALFRQSWGGRCIFKRMTVIPSGGPKDRVFSHYYEPFGYSPGSPILPDVACKPLLHPSCRTFDVRIDSTGTKPCITSIEKVDGREFCSWRPEITSYRSSVRGFPEASRIAALRQLSIRNGSNSCDACTGVLVHGAPGDRDVTSGLYLFDNKDEHRLLSRRSLDDNNFPNDFGISDKLIMFAPNRETLNGDARVRALSVWLHHDRHVDNESILSASSGFPMSDAFCIDACPDDGLLRSAFAMGHRNGQLSVLDYRAPNPVCKVTEKLTMPHRHETNCFGAATAITWLSNGYELLAKGSFGDLRLYDVRMMGIASRRDAPPSTRLNDTSLVCGFSLPPQFDQVRSKMSKFCNGVALDPLETMAVAPLLNEHEEPCFGAWSIRTGRWIGERAVTPIRNLDNQQSVQSPPYLELCKTTTPSFETNEKGEGLVNSVGGISFWFKCSLSVSEPSGEVDAARRGSIHQLSFNGHNEAR